MSVIQQIRDKYARWAVVAIAVSLLGFIMMDAFSGRSSLGGNSTTIGKINGKEIEFIDFDRKMKAQEEMYKQQGYDMGEAGRQQVLESVWEGELTNQLMQAQFDELGMTIGRKELTDMLFGNNPPQDLKQRFTDPNTGVYNAAAAQQAINELRKSARPEDKAQFNEYLGSLEFSRMMEKYTSLLTNSTYFPKWFVEKQNVDNSLIGSAAFVSVPYASISDSAVKVTDDDIKKYINEHKKDFEQKEETRSISYVVFSAAPTAADSMATRTQVESLRSQFAAAPDPGAFVTQQGTASPFHDGYLGGTQIQIPVKDSIFALPSGGIYGPYLDGNHYVLARKVDVKVMPDSAKVRHILIQTANPQTGQVMLDDSAARKRIDSIHLAIKGGANFDSLALRFSDDAGSKEKGGVYDYFPQGQMVKAFNEFAFEKPVGSRDVVKTEFGYHLIEVLGQKGSQPHYKIAYLSKPIVPSSETDATAANAANQFAGESKDLKAFNTYFDKNLKAKGVNKLVAQDVRPMDYQITGLGASRQLVRAIFDADKGDVLQPERIGDNYVVAAVTDVNPAGVPSVSRARATVEPILRNQKKAAQIKQRIGTVSTLETASTTLGQPIQTADSVRFVGPNSVLGFESKVIGAVFNPANKGKVVPEAIEGQSGVFVVRVNNVSAMPVGNADIDQQRRMMVMQARQGMMYRNPVEALKQDAKIKDNRAKFY
jgi:peptidyl-prolyl cis-trans isomerase D